MCNALMPAQGEFQCDSFQESLDSNAKSARESSSAMSRTEVHAAGRPHPGGMLPTPRPQFDRFTGSRWFAEGPANGSPPSKAAPSHLPLELGPQFLERLPKQFHCGPPGKLGGALQLGALWPGSSHFWGAKVTMWWFGVKIIWDEPLSSYHHQL